MAQKYPGLYLYYDWMDGLLQIEPEKAMQIIANLYRFSKDGEDPQPLEDGMCNIMQNIFIAGMKRNKKNAENGRIGGTISSCHRSYGTGTAMPPAHGHTKKQNTIPEWDPLPPPESLNYDGLEEYLQEFRTREIARIKGLEKFAIEHNRMDEKAAAIFADMKRIYGVEDE